MKIEYQHTLTVFNAYERMADLFDLYRTNQRIDTLNAIWCPEDQEFLVKATVMGIDIKGEAVMTDQKVVIQGELPWVARPFTKLIKTKVKKTLERVLSEV